MPRLSIIVPHRRDDTALENTVLSVLENRPHDSEIIVVHNGSYSDPYQLEDELLLVTENCDSDIELLNAGIQASQSSIVCLLCNGATVTDQHWADAALRELDHDRMLAAVAVPSRTASLTSFGIRVGNQLGQPVLSRSQIESKQSTDTTAPSLSCGFYRRQALERLGGWNAELSWDLADIEMAMMFNDNKLRCGCVADMASLISLPTTPVDSVSCVKQVAELTAAFGLRDSSALTVGLDLIRGLLQCKPLRAMAWVSGRPAATKQTNLRHRRQSAKRRFHQHLEPVMFQDEWQTAKQRRAA